MTVSQVEIEFENISVQRGRRRSVKPKPAGVNPVARCAYVVGREAPCYVFEKVPSRLVDAGSYSIRVSVSLVDLGRGQTHDPARSTCWTRRIAEICVGVFIPNNALGNVSQWHKLHGRSGSGLAQPFIREEEESLIVFDGTAH